MDVCSHMLALYFCTPGKTDGESIFFQFVFNAHGTRCQFVRTTDSSGCHFDRRSRAACANMNARWVPWCAPLVDTSHIYSATLDTTVSFAVSAPLASSFHKPKSMNGQTRTRRKRKLKVFDPRCILCVCFGQILQCILTVVMLW